VQSHMLLQRALTGSGGRSCWMIPMPRAYDLPATSAYNENMHLL